MASISYDAATGRRTIQFVDRDRKRRTIRLGAVPQRTAETIRVRVEALNAAAVTGCPLDAETARWVAGIGAELAGRLAKVGLVAARVSATLGPFIDSFIKGRSDVKGSTRVSYGLSTGRILEFFGADRNLRSITEGDADAWLVWLRSKYAAATISRTVRHASQFFRSAVRRGILDKNPFAELKAPGQSNAARLFFVTRDVAAKVLEQCPDNEWRLIFALSRFGGLRCPSEHLSLRWQDIDWHKGKMLVHSPKREHLEGGGDRWVPLFPELRPHLEAAFESAPDGAEFVIARYRDTNANLRTQFNRILRRAGLTPWPRLFQNLRASRETELAESYPLHVVCAWIGNTAKIAAAHYLQVTDEHFERGAAPGAAAVAGGALHNPLRHAASPSLTERDDGQKSSPEERLVTLSEVPCGSMVKPVVAAAGLESNPATTFTDNRLRQMPDSSAAKGAALQATSAPLPSDGTDDADLEGIIAAWPALSADVRARVVALVRQAEGTHQAVQDDAGAGNRDGGPAAG